MTLIVAKIMSSGKKWSLVKHENIQWNSPKHITCRVQCSFRNTTTFIASVCYYNIYLSNCSYVSIVTNLRAGQLGFDSR